MEHKGIFITYEGQEGSGKTTHIELLKERMINNGVIITTREPGGTPFAEDIRELLLNPREDTNKKVNLDHAKELPEDMMDMYLFPSKEKINPIAEALLFAAARAQHVSTLIKPNLDAGRIVISDRYIDSSLVYQGVFRGLGIKKVMNINRPAIRGIMPDLTFFMDLPAEEAMERKIQKCHDNQEKLDRIESEGIDLFNYTRNGYLEVAKLFPKRIVLIDASRLKSEVSGEIADRTEYFLKQHQKTLKHR